MKKSKKVLMIIAAVLSIVMIMGISSIAFAADAASFTAGVSGPTSVKQGDTVQYKVTFTVNSGEGMGAFDAAVSTSGLSVQSASVTSGQSFFTASCDASNIVLANDTNVVNAGGSVTVTYTAKVTAQPGGAVSFGISGVHGGGRVAGVATPATYTGGSPSVSGTVATDPVPPTDEPAPPTDQPTDQPTSDPTAQPSASASAKADDLDDVPKTGDTSMPVWPFVAMGIAAAGVLAFAVGKKAHSK